MSYELKQAVIAVQENNILNDGAWSDWSDAHHIAETYEIALDESAVRVIQRAIDSDGVTLDADLSAAELAEWGQNFSPSWWK